jgi:predicted dehydrogenase
LGQWGRHHARVFSSMPGVELAGVVDSDAREVAAAAARHSTRGFTDYRDLIGKVDAVSVVVPTALHYPVARDLLEAGIHIMLEKPMTATVEQARRLIELNARRATVMLVGHVERFKPAVQWLSRIARDPLHIQTRRVRPYDPTRAMDVGVVLDLMIHDIDIVLSLVPGRVVDVGGVGVRVHNDEEDLAVAHLTLETGCRVTLVASRVSAVKAVEMEITTGDRSIHLDYLREIIHVRPFRGEPQRLVMDGSEPLRAELSHFVACVRGQEQPRVTAEDGARALEVTHRLLRNLIGISPGVPA